MVVLVATFSCFVLFLCFVLFYFCMILHHLIHVVCQHGWTTVTVIHAHLWGWFFGLQTGTSLLTETSTPFRCCITNRFSHTFVLLNIVIFNMQSNYFSGNTSTIVLKVIWDIYAKWNVVCWYSEIYFKYAHVIHECWHIQSYSNIVHCMILF